MSVRRYEDVKRDFVARVGDKVIVLADPPPVQVETLEGATTYAMDFTPWDDISLKPGTDVTLAIRDGKRSSLKRMFTGNLDSVQAQSDPWDVRVRATGVLSRLGRIRTGGKLDLTGMTDGEAIRAILDEVKVPYRPKDIDDAGYRLGDQVKVVWANREPASDIVQRLNEVFGAALIETGSGSVARIFYDLAPTKGKVVKVYRAGEDSSLFGLSRSRGGGDRVANNWRVTGVTFQKDGKKDCSYTPYAQSRGDNGRAGSGSMGRQEFQSDIIQDKKLAEQVVRRLMRWHNREPDEITLETLNDPQMSVGMVVGVRDGTYGMALSQAKRYTVMSIDRSGAFMTLGLVGGNPGKVGKIQSGYDKECNEVFTEDPEPIPDPPLWDDLPVDPTDPDYIPDLEDEETPWPVPEVPIPVVPEEPIYEVPPDPIPDGDTGAVPVDPVPVDPLDPIDVPVDEGTGDTSLAVDPPDPCEPPCECAAAINLYDGMAADGTLGIRVTGTLTVGTIDTEIGFHGEDGDYKFRIGSSMVGRGADIVTPTGTIQVGDTPFVTGAEVDYVFCWSPIDGALTLSVTTVATTVTEEAPA